MSTPIAFRHVNNLSRGSLGSIVLPAVILLCCSLVSWAQSPPLSLGTVSTFVPHTSCPTGKDSNNTPLSQAACYSTSVDNCPGYNRGTIPAVDVKLAVSTPTTGWNGGTIVFFSGGDGEDFFNEPTTTISYPEYYYDHGFQVVQVAWGANDNTWRDNNGQPHVKVMKYEGCRPATLLRALYDSSLVHGLSGGSGEGGMCAQGHSTGATAIAFALAWYGAGSGTTAYLNNVLFTSGPPQANIKAGCQFPAAQQYSSDIEVCGVNGVPNGMCHVGTSGTWPDCTQYLKGGTSCASQSGSNPNAAQSVARYTHANNNTNDPPGNCNNYLNDSQNLTTNFDSDWGGMSVVSSNAVYSYSTSIEAFLCASGERQNNSAAQAWLYLQNVTSPTPAVYRVDACGGDEKIWFGYTENGSSTNRDAFATSANAMLNHCIKPALPPHP